MASNTAEAVICSLLSSIVLILLFLTSKFILSNKRQVFMVYWLEFLIMMIIFLGYNVLMILKSLEIGNIDNFKINIITNVSTCYIILMNLVNIITMLCKLSSIKHIQKLKDRFSNLSKELNNINISGIFSTGPFIAKNLILLSLTVVAGVFLFKVGDEDIKDEENNNIHHSILVYFGFILLIFLQLFLSRILLCKYKAVVQKDFVAESLINERLMKRQVAKICAICDQLMFKTNYDMILLFPVFMGFIYKIDDNYITDDNNNNKDSGTNEKLMIFYWIMQEFCFLFYFILQGSLFLSINKENGVPAPKIISIFYCSKHTHYYFYSKRKVIKTLQKDFKSEIGVVEPLIENNHDTININNNNNDNININININNNNSKVQSMLKVPPEILDSSILSSPNTITQKSENALEDPEPKDKKIPKIVKDFLPCNFYLIFKILYMFLKKNQDVYERIEKNADEERGLPFKELCKTLTETRKSVDIKNDEKKKQYNEFVERISRVSRMSINTGHHIIPRQKYKLIDMMSTMSDKIIKEEFINRVIKGENNNNKDIRDLDIDSERILVNDTSHDNFEFEVESLCHDTLIEAYPFYQVKIRDLLEALDVSKNMNLLNKFSDDKMQKCNFMMNPNLYFTHDDFVSFEIYDHNNLPFDTLKNFLKNYIDYLMNRIRDFKFTFLPLILGLYNIKYKGYDKLIVLYKNPLAFEKLVNSKFWIHFCIRQDSERVRSSTGGQDSGNLANLNEIELKDNMKLSDYLFKELEENLKDDMDFLKKQQYELNCRLNLFVIKDQKSTQNSSINEEALDRPSVSLFQQQDGVLDEMIRNSNAFSQSCDKGFNINNAKKYFGSDYVSILEIYYNAFGGDGGIMFKVYFSDIFRVKVKSGNVVKYEGKKKKKSGDNNLINTNNNNNNNNDIDEALLNSNTSHTNSLYTKVFRRIEKYNSSILED